MRSGGARKVEPRREASERSASESSRRDDRSEASSQASSRRSRSPSSRSRSPSEAEGDGPVLREFEEELIRHLSSQGEAVRWADVPVVTALEREVSTLVWKFLSKVVDARRKEVAASFDREFAERRKTLEAEHGAKQRALQRQQQVLEDACAAVEKEKGSLRVPGPSRAGARSQSRSRSRFREDRVAKAGTVTLAPGRSVGVARSVGGGSLSVRESYKPDRAVREDPPARAVRKASAEPAAPVAVRGMRADQEPGGQSGRAVFRSELPKAKPRSEREPIGLAGGMLRALRAEPRGGGGEGFAPPVRGRGAVQAPRVTRIEQPGAGRR